MYEFTPMRPDQGNRKKAAGHSLYPKSNRANKAHDLINKALAFCAALVVIWAITHFMTSNSVPPGEIPDNFSSTQNTVIPPVQTDANQAETSTLATAREANFWNAGTFAALAMLAGGILLAYVLRRRTGRTAAGRILMKTISHMPITGEQQLRLVTCADEVLLLSVAPTHTTLLKSYPVSAFRKKQSGQLTSVKPISAGRRTVQNDNAIRYQKQSASQQINTRQKRQPAKNTPPINQPEQSEPSFSRVLRDYFGQRAEKYLRDEADWR